MKQNFNFRQGVRPAIIVIWLLGAVSSAAIASTGNTPVWLEGLIIDQNLSPIANARIANEDLTVTTGQNGTFSMGPIYGDFTRVTVDAEGYQTDITDIPLSDIRGAFEVVLVRDSSSNSEGDKLLSVVPTRVRRATADRQKAKTPPPPWSDAAACSLPPVPSLDGPSGLINIPTAQGFRNRQHAVGVHFGRQTTATGEIDVSIYKASVGLSDQIEAGVAFYEEKPDAVGSTRQSQTKVHLKYSGKSPIENVSYCMGAQASTGDSNVFLGATYDGREVLGSLVLKDNPDVKQPTFNLGLEIPVDPYRKRKYLAGHSLIMEMEEEASTSQLDQYTMGWRYRSDNGGNIDFYHSRRHNDSNNYITGVGGSVTF